MPRFPDLQNILSSHINTLIKTVDVIKITRRARINGRRRGERSRTYLDENKGIICNTLWISQNIVLSDFSKERNGYPTQKPLKLLERIIKASSNQGDVVLDPFCGSGTTLRAAKTLGRKYIGIDQNPEAIRITENRLNPPQQEYSQRKGETSWRMSS